MWWPPGCTISLGSMVTFLVALGIVGAWTAAAAAREQAGASPADPPATPVNWLYGAYVPAEVPLVPLSPDERRELWIRQAALTPGIFLKTGFFALGDQLNDAPAEWDADLAGLAQRFTSRYGQFAVQTSVSAAANWMLRYEPRYDRCRCSGVWPRMRHALVRNFVTYNRTERERRPQFGMYVGAWTGGLLASTWKPAKDDVWREGYEAIVTQAIFGSLANLAGEFARELTAPFRRSPAAQRARPRTERAGR
jgi:hypothetical protein